MMLIASYILLFLYVCLACLKVVSSANTLPWALARANLPGTSAKNADGSCPIFPPDNSPWHQDISTLPTHPNTDAIISKIGTQTIMHNDFGGGEGRGKKRILYGVPFNFVASAADPTLLKKVRFVDYGDESDNDPYPIPKDALVEGSHPTCQPAKCDGDRHVLVVDNSTCKLYELYNAKVNKRSGQWLASSGAMYNMLDNKLRPLGWTSADAAGLPMFPGLVKYEETVVQGYIDHAIRFTGPNSRAAYQLPATHFAPHGDKGSNSPWMGMRVRLRSSFNCNSLSSEVGRTICTAMKRFGLIFADNGSPWFLTGEANAKWDPLVDEIHDDLARIRGSDMEVVDTGVCLCLDADCTRSEPGGASSSCA